MNIIFYRYNSIYEPDMIDAFTRSGLNVIEITEEMTDKDISNARRIKLLEACISENAPLFVYGINYYPAIAEVCRILNVPYLSQTVDSPILTLFDRSIRNATNRIFLFDRAQYDLYSRYNPDGIFHLPLASATDRFDKVISSINDNDRQRFSSDISFVGSTYREKDPLASLTGLSDYTKGYIDAMVESSMKIYGYYPVKDALDKRVVSEIKEAAGDDFPVFKDGVSESDNYVVSHRYIGSHIAVAERERSLSLLSKFFHVDLYTRSDISSLENTATIITDSQDAVSGANRAVRAARTDRADRTGRTDKTNSIFNSDSIDGKNVLAGDHAASGLSQTGVSHTGLHVHPGVNSLTEMPKVFNLSRINLNITMRPIETGLPLRCFDILGCGGFLMTNYQPELEDMFIIGEDLEAYSSLEELVDKCSYYLTHEDERAAIAHNGYEKVKSNHTHIHRLKEMLKTM